MPHSKQSMTAATCLKHGDDAFHAGNNPVAIAYYSRLIDLKPANAMAWYKRATAYFNQENFAEAIDDCSKAMSLDKNSIKAMTIRGLSKQSLGRFEDAAVDLSFAIDKQPNNPMLYVKRANCFYNLKKYADAVNDFDACIRLHQKEASVVEADVIYYRGKAHYFLAHYDLAILDFNQFIDQNPLHGGAIFYRGQSYSMQNRNELALRDYNRCIELNPHNADFFSDRSEIYLQMANYPLAISDLDECLRLNPSHAVALFNRGLYYVRHNNYDQAIVDFTKYIELSPSGAQIFCFRGLAYYHQRHFPQAIADFSQAIDLQPDCFKALVNRAKIYYWQGDYELAIADLTRSTDLKPSFANGFNYIGLAYYALGQHHLAIQAYDKAIVLNPEHPTAFDYRALAQKALDEQSSADSDLRETGEIGSPYGGTFFGQAPSGGSADHAIAPDTAAGFSM